MALGLALAWCMLTSTAQVELSIDCDGTPFQITLDPCNGISQQNLPAACATANTIALTNPALSTVQAVVQGDQVFAQRPPPQHDVHSAWLPLWHAASYANDKRCPLSVRGLCTARLSSR